MTQNATTNNQSHYPIPRENNAASTPLNYIAGGTHLGGDDGGGPDDEAAKRPPRGAGLADGHRRRKPVTFDGGPPLRSEGRGTDPRAGELHRRHSSSR